jgi:hypothetical protein
VGIGVVSRTLLAMALKRSKRARAAAKRQRRMEKADNDLTAEEWSALQAHWDGCAYCNAKGKKLDERSFLLRNHEIRTALVEQFTVPDDGNQRSG